MDKELQTRFDGLPTDIQAAMGSTHVVEKLQALGQKYSLHLDQLGQLETCVTKTMLGIDKTSDFIENIEENLQISTEDAINIATDVNISIFLPIRDSLMKIQGETETKTNIAAKESEAVNPQKEDILAEIENPTPVQPPISSAGVVIPKVPQATTVAHEFIAGKMNEPVSLPAQKYSADPYREPLA